MEIDIKICVVEHFPHSHSRTATAARRTRRPGQATHRATAEGFPGWPRNILIVKYMQIQLQ